MMNTKLPSGEVVWTGLYAGRMFRIVKNGGMLTSEFCRKDGLGNDAWIKTKNQEYAPFYIHVVKDLLRQKRTEECLHDAFGTFFGTKYPCNG